jgi:hypothetical protein
MNLAIPSSVYKRLRAYVLAVTTEISFLGKVTKINPRSVLLEDIFLLPQFVGGSHTTIEKESLGKFYDALMQKGENPSSWRAWIHSHADMNAFYSSTDEDTIESFDLECPEENWFLSLVVNRAGTLIPRIDVFSPYRITISDVEWEIVFDQTDIMPEIQKEILEKVFKKEPTNLKDVLKTKKWFPNLILPKQIDIIDIG